MPAYRLAYPTHLYATIDAPDVATAKHQFVAILEEHQDGLLLDPNLVGLGICQPSDPNTVVYPDSDTSGDIVPDRITVENEE